ncbi:MAG: hypothetical protein MRERC_5c049 [Mycoplasmataceae bacterium RC_NB112A]|nr:MAG: hypothetical protein MRERC_5c049 [Mycoplasmataceae bacterium RC_NB112A]
MFVYFTYFWLGFYHSNLTEPVAFTLNSNQRQLEV